LYFHALEFADGKQWKYWGQMKSQNPKTNAQGKYVLANPQENISETNSSNARAIINKNFPEAIGLPLRKSIWRQFPGTHNRYVIVLRHKTSEVRYVVLSTAT